MTVAAVIVAASPADALADAGGTPAVRRLADVAWAGGATPVVVCVTDADGDVGRALANAEVTVVEPVASGRGPVGQIVNGIEAALQLIVETDAVIVWPARMAWVDAETVTTLISAHGQDRGTGVRPAWQGEPGWPALLPIAHLAALRGLGADRSPDELLADLATAGVPFRIVETGDPGVRHDIATPRASLPAYDGPPEPADAHAHEWGAAAADEPDDAPVPAPGRIVVDPAG